MNRLLTALRTATSELTGNKWSFFHGTQSQLNEAGDEVLSPCVFLRAPLTADETLTTNKLVRDRYNLTMYFLMLREPSYTAQQNEQQVTDCNNARIEFLRRLFNQSDTRGEVFTAITSIRVLPLYNEFDSNWTGVSMTVTVELYDGFDVCLT